MERKDQEGQEMGRHRRLDAGSAADEQRPAAAAGRSAARSHRRNKRASTPVRTGLLGVSAAVAMGAVAVASGLIPGGDGGYTVDGGKEPGKVQSAGSPSDLETRSSGPDRKETAASRGSERPEPSTSSPAPSKSPSSPSAEPSAKPSESKTGDGGSGKTEGGKKEQPAKTESPAPQKPSEAAPSDDTEQSAEAEVLTLVNKERAQAGCSPVRADGDLAELAGAFSKDMAERGFFDHTDPDGDTPWDRADAAGISNLGGENIARGQANAQSVMDSWMNSPGHKANILNCEYKTLGVGAHFASGGPWWTQDFGF